MSRYINPVTQDDVKYGYQWKPKNKGKTGFHRLSGFSPEPALDLIGGENDGYVPNLSTVWAT